MVGSFRLTLVRRPLRFAALVAIVIAVHVVSLRWLSNELEGPPLIKPMATPMFTRLLTPQAPVIVAKDDAHPPPAKTRPGAMTAVKARTAEAAKAASSAASAAASAASAAIASATPAAQPASASASASASSASAPASSQAEAASPPPETQLAASAPAPSLSPVAAAPAPAAPASTALVIAPDTWPADTRLTYRLGGFWNGDLTGSARVLWLRKGDRYEARIDLDLGLFTLQFISQGNVAGENLAPSAYQEAWLGRARGVRLGDDTVTLNDGRTVVKPPGTQDTASQLVELSHRFSTGREKLVVGGVTSFWLARPGGVDLWTYDVIGIDHLETRHFGTIDAYHLMPRPIKDARGNIYSEIWIAPSLQYLPARIKLTQGPQTYVDVVVDQVEQR